MIVYLYSLTSLLWNNWKCAQKSLHRCVILWWMTQKSFLHNFWRSAKNPVWLNFKWWQRPIVMSTVGEGWKLTLKMWRLCTTTNTQSTGCTQLTWGISTPVSTLVFTLQSVAGVSMNLRCLSAKQHTVAKLGSWTSSDQSEVQYIKVSNQKRIYCTQVFFSVQHIFTPECGHNIK